MTIIATLAEVTLRALLGRRRAILLVLLAGLPVLVGLLARIGGGRLEPVPILDAMVVRTVLPLTALVFGTSALGSELEDGTAVHVLVKPIPRWQIIVAKVVVAGALSSALTVTSTVLSGVLVGGTGTTELATTFAMAVSAGIAAFGYVALFVAISVITTRAMIIGLIYVLVWEGVLAGVLAATKMFSVREATLGLAGALAPEGSGIETGLEPVAAVILLAAVIAGGLVVGSIRLAGYEVRGTE